MSETVKAEVSTGLARRFRRRVVDVYGHKKGAVKKALQDLITRFVGTGRADWGSMRGVLKIDMGSVELQHQVWKKTD